MLNHEFQHLAHNQLLRHRLGRNVDDIRLAEEAVGHSAHGNEQYGSCPRIGSAYVSCDACGAFQPRLELPQCAVHHEREHGDQEAPRNRKRGVVRRNAAIDGNTETARTDKGRNAGKCNRHRRHIANPGHDDGHRKRNLNARQHMKRRAAHADCRLHKRGLYLREPRMRRTHHRQECVDRECNDRRAVADAEKRNQKSEHRNRRDRIEEVHRAKRRCRRALITMNEDARRPAEHDSDADCCPRDPQMLNQKLYEERTAF